MSACPTPLPRPCTPSLQVSNDPERAEAARIEAARFAELAERALASPLLASSNGGGGQATSAALPLTHSLMHVVAEGTQQLAPSESTGVVVVSAVPQSLGQITFASQTACRILGYSRAQVRAAGG